MAEPTQEATIAADDGGPPPPDAQTGAALRACIEHQQAGRAAEARAGLDAILARQPDNPDALHLLGVMQFVDGRTAEGVALLERAVSQVPRFASAMGNLAEMLNQLKRPAEAMALLRRATSGAKQNPLALQNLGYGLLKAGDLAGAAEQFMVAVQLDPDDGVSHAGLGTARLRQQRFHEAEASLRQALGLRPAEPEIHMNLGVCLRMLGKLDEAIGSLRVALLLRTDYPQAQVNLGLVLLERGRTDEAAASLRQAAAADPQLGEAHFALGMTLRGMGDTAGAVASLRRAVATLGNPAPAYNALSSMLATRNDAGAQLELEQAMAARAPREGTAPQGTQPAAQDVQQAAQGIRMARALARAGRLDEAVAACEQLLARDPGAVDAIGTIAAIRYVQGQYEAARAGFNAVLAAVPDEPAARTTVAMMRLADGDFTAGLAGFEARFDLPQLAAFRPAGTRLPALAGGPALAGKRVLLAAEQGQGDTLQFVRYAKQLANRGATVLLEVQAPLVALLSAMPGIAGVSAQGAPSPAVDFTCPMMSLPLAFGTTIDTIPAAVPYLAVPAERRAAWRARLGAPGGGAGNGQRRIGLCWSGNPGFSADQFRSIPLERFAGLLGDPRLAMHLVQTDIRDGDDALVAAHPGTVDLRRELADFADTAAVIEQLDLVITVDTAVAHLAGALGRPVWILLPYGADWRWLQDRNDSPWYPTARLFRQAAMGDWQPVLAAVQTALLPR